MGAEVKVLTIDGPQASGTNGRSEEKMEEEEQMQALL